ncbi:hypothetical protein [Heyndrickxia faecalis]|uniref:hypothetical protein n=1 Tax=Heyndrickxia faecalis TaxID=2824910 RepID=UPI003D20D157
MPTEFKIINVDDIVVNILNPRYEPQISEIEAMDLIINNGKILELMHDIVKYGLDSSENLVVSYDKDLEAYISEEGNRRITAIKLLNDPELTPTFTINRDNFINKIRKMKKDYNYKKITEVNCVIFDDQEKMKHFIELKHTGDNNGAGRINWKAENRYRYKEKTVPFKAYLVDYLSEMFPKYTGSFNISTIEIRILGDPAMRAAMDMIVKKKPPLIKFYSKEGYARFHFIVNGLMNETFTVRDFYYKDDRINFIDKYFSDKQLFKEDLFIPEKLNTFDISIKKENKKDNVINAIGSRNHLNKERLKSENTGTHQEKLPLDIKEEVIPNISEDEIEKNRSTKRTYNKRQKEREQREYPFKGINYKGDNIGISQSLFELHRINVKDFKLATTFLIRTLLECTIQEYIIFNNIEIKIKNSTPVKQLSIDSLLKECSDKSKVNFKSLEKTDRVVARIIFEAHQKRDADELNMVSHGNFREPSVDSIWDIERRWYSAIKIMIEDISGHER